MSTETPQLGDYFSQHATETEGTPHTNAWETITIDDEQFSVIRGLKVYTEHGGKPVVFDVTEYQHPETNMRMTVYSLGLDRPLHEPAPVRADYACPCMNLGSSFHMQGHDCVQQRDLMLGTMTELGIGVMAIVSEETAAGNGHGSQAVHRQATIQYEAAQHNLPIPTMQQAFNEMGYYDDLRRHDIVAKVIKDTIGERPAIATTSNTDKIKQLEQAGVAVVPQTRIELVTEQSLTRQQLLGRREYDHLRSVSKPGAYLVNGKAELFTPQTYHAHFLAESESPRTHHFFRRFQRHSMPN